MTAASYGPLLAMGAVFIAAGWLALRKSRRVARFWAATGLLMLAAASVLDMQQTAGPWWPLAERSWSPAEWSAIAVWLAGLALIFRVRIHACRWALWLLAGGAVLFAIALVAATFGHSSQSGLACPGQPVQIGPWTASLRRLDPVVGADYSGVKAELSLRPMRGEAIIAAPEHRTPAAAAAAPRAGSASIVRWNDELLVEAQAKSASPECAQVTLTSRSYGQWLRHAAWLMLLGALILSATALRSAWWRTGALERIAMRREDQGRVAMPGAKRAWLPAVLAPAAALTAYAAQPAPTSPAPAVALDGTAMIAARQARFGGLHLDNRWLVTADALARHGQFGNAATMLLGAVESEPGNAEAWTALGDALTAQAGGRVVPAAQLAYSRAAPAAR